MARISYYTFESPMCLCFRVNWVMVDWLLSKMNLWFSQRGEMGNEETAHGNRHAPLIYDNWESIRASPTLKTQKNENVQPLSIANMCQSSSGSSEIPIIWSLIMNWNILYSLTIYLIRYVTIILGNYRYWIIYYRMCSENRLPHWPMKGRK